MRRHDRSPAPLRTQSAGACACAITRPAVTGRRTRSSPRCGPPGSRRRPCSTGRSTPPAFGPTWSKCWPRPSDAGDVVVLDNLAVHKQPEVRDGHRSHRRADPLSAALQSRLQPDRDGVRETQSVHAGRASAHLRPRHGAHRGCARALHARPDSKPKRYSKVGGRRSYEKRCSPFEGAHCQEDAVRSDVEGGGELNGSAPRHAAAPCN